MNLTLTRKQAIQAFYDTVTLAGNLEDVMDAEEALEIQNGMKAVQVLFDDPNTSDTSVGVLLGFLQGALAGQLRGKLPGVELMLANILNNVQEDDKENN